MNLFFFAPSCIYISACRLTLRTYCLKDIISSSLAHNICNFFFIHNVNIKKLVKSIDVCSLFTIINAEQTGIVSLFFFVCDDKTNRHFVIIT